MALRMRRHEVNQTDWIACDAQYQTEGSLYILPTGLTLLHLVCCKLPNSGKRLHTSEIHSLSLIVQEFDLSRFVSLSERNRTFPSTKWNAASTIARRLATDVDVAITNNTIIWYLAACTECFLPSPCASIQVCSCSWKDSIEPYSLL